MAPFAAIDPKVGQKIYARTCSVCHGERGNAASWAQKGLNPSPLDFTSYKAKQMSRRHMINTVSYGKDGTTMMGFTIQLTRSQIASVVDHVRSKYMFPGQPAASSKLGIAKANIPNNGILGTHNRYAPTGRPAMARGHHGQHSKGPADMSAPFPNDLNGDPGKGREFFEANCAVCHGKGGLGNGPRAYFINPRPANLNDKRSRAEINRPHLFISISDGLIGTVMPAWSKVLSDQKIADVAEYVFNAFIQPVSFVID